MQRYTVYLYPETALHVSGGTSTNHQQRLQLFLQHPVFVTPLLLSAAIVEELEPVWVCCGWRTPPTTLKPKMKLRLKGQRFVSIEEAQAESQQILNTLTPVDFNECFQKWQNRWDHYMQAKGDYFKGDGGN
jgi:hypothetical protein